MANIARPVGEEELQAWLDGRLTPERSGGIVNLTESRRAFRPLSVERGQPYRRAKRFPAPSHRATDRRSITPLLKLTMPPPPVLPEEPTAVTPHGGFCGGKSQQWLRYPTL